MVEPVNITSEVVTTQKHIDIKAYLERFCPHFFDEPVCERCSCRCPVDVCFDALRKPH